MSSWMLGLASCLYLVTAVDLVAKGQPWMALGFFSYALANVGFIGAIR